jgi:hypothetical protein
VDRRWKIIIHLIPIIPHINMKPKTCPITVRHNYRRGNQFLPKIVCCVTTREQASFVSQNVYEKGKDRRGRRGRKRKEREMRKRRRKRRRMAEKAFKLSPIGQLAYTLRTITKLGTKSASPHRQIS